MSLLVLYISKGLGQISQMLWLVRKLIIALGLQTAALTMDFYMVVTQASEIHKDPGCGRTTGLEMAPGCDVTMASGNSEGRSDQYDPV